MVSQDIESDHQGYRTGPNSSTVFVLSFCVATVITAEFLPASLLPLLAKCINITQGAAGQSIAATALVALFSSLLTASLSKGVDRRRLVMMFAIISIASSLIVAATTSFQVLIFGRLLLGLSVGGFWAMAASSAMRLVPADAVSRALTLVLGGASVSMVASAPLGSVLAGMFAWLGVFALAGIVLAASVNLVLSGVTSNRRMAGDALPE